MQLQIFRDFEMIDIIDTFVSFEHCRCYQEAGQFTLECNSLEHREALRPNFYIMVEDEPLLIENVHKYKTGTNELRLEVTGRQLSAILDRRVIAALTVDRSKTFEDHMYTLVKDNFAEPTDPKRKIEHFRLAGRKGLAEIPKEIYQFENTDCLDIIKTLCQESGLGFRIHFYPEDNYMEFEVYKGKDKTEDVFFSEEYGNVSDSEIYEQTQDYKNVVYLNGSEVIGEAQGLERREFIVTGSEKGEAMKELNDRCQLSAAECTVLLSEQFAYKKDWDIGDVITFQDNSLGFVVEQPILEVKEIYKDILEIEVNFGDKIPTVFEKLVRR